jgi:glutamate/tyrosine decarboxylase-like PLP-dependent enzyme
LIGSASGRFFGWVIGSTLPAAVAADWLTSVWDQNAALHACSPSAAVVEEVVGAWLKELLALPPQSSFALVTGCQMAHATGLAAARGAVLRKLGWDVAERGLYGAPTIRILANAQRHASIVRAAILLGLGRANIEPLATDELGRVIPSALEQALIASGGAPAIVVLQAGDIATGAFDDFNTLIPQAKAAGAWVHIDGAFGLWARASARYRHLASGCELADSWGTDGHKILNTPFDCGYAFVAHPEDHKAAFSLRASYLTHAQDARDQIDWNPDWSRRARGFPTYAALRSLGRLGVEAVFDNCCEQARALADGLAKLPGVDLLSTPLINQALVRFRDPDPHAGEVDHDRRTDAVIAAINATGEAFFTGADWCGRRVMRISVCSWRTDEADVERAIAAARSVLLSNRLGVPAAQA